jgi:hypothetical protein
MKKIRSSTKIAVGFALLIALVWFGYQKVTDWMIMGQKFTPIIPGRVNIVGINLGAGYRVIVSNELAQLVETQGGFGSNESQDASEGEGGEGSIKKRIPIREMLQSLQGDPKALGTFVMTMNDLSENDLPPIRVIWSKDDLEKAFNGDSTLKAKLVRDLNMDLDGTPLPSLRIASLEDGIVLKIPVTVTVDIYGKPTPVTGDVLQAYQPRMMKAVQADYATDPSATNEVKAGYYEEEAHKALKGVNRDNIEQSIKNILDQAKSYADYPERILKSATVILNENYIDHAQYDTYTSSNGKPLHNLTIDLNDEGRRRLWQYSKNRVGETLLLVSEGVAIAAPRIQAPLMGGEIEITQMSDQTVLDDFKSTLAEAKSKGASQPKP